MEHRAGEEDNTINQIMTTSINIQDMIEAYFDALELREQFIIMNTWMLEQIGLHKNFKRHLVRDISNFVRSLHLDMIPTNMFVVFL